MTYQRLLTEYAHPTRRWENTSVSRSEKRLRWLQHEACGNTRNEASIYNIRRAHMKNRCLQQKLDKDIHTMARLTARSCAALQNEQTKMWKSGLKKDFLTQNHLPVIANDGLADLEIFNVQNTKEADPSRQMLPSISRSSAYSGVSRPSANLREDFISIRRPMKTRRRSVLEEWAEGEVQSRKDTMPFSSVKDYVVHRRFYDPGQYLTCSVLKKRTGANPCA